MMGGVRAFGAVPTAGLPPPGWSGALSAWTLDPLTTALVVLLLAGCLAGARRGVRHPAGRWALLLAGCLVALVAVDGWPGRYAGALASVFVVRLCAVLLVAPVLLAFGRPQPLLAAAVGRGGVPRRPGGPRPAYRRRAWARPAGRVLRHPLVGPIALPVLLGALIFTPAFGQFALHRPAGWLLDSAALLAGFALASPLPRVGEAGGSLAVGLVLFVGLAELLIDAIPGIALRLDGHVLPAVAALARQRGWGPSAVHDQQLAGAILWGLAELIDLPYLAVVFRQWVRADQREAAVADSRPPAAPPDGPAEAGEGLQRPWWESDASVFGDRRTRDLQRRPPDTG